MFSGNNRNRKGPQKTVNREIKLNKMRSDNVYRTIIEKNYNNNNC